MANQLRKTGINVLGDIPWGTHFCHFYETKKDFVELLTAYFKTGLENNEYCLWAISNPFNVEKVLHSLSETVPGFNDHLARRNFEILPITEWYLKEGKFDPKGIVDEWLHRLDDAQKRGFDGMRIHGNKGWLEEEDWESYQQYERELSNSIGGHRIIALCTYPLAKADAATFLDVVHLHGRVVSTRKGEWKVLHDAEIVQLHGELMQKNLELEAKIEERTLELEKTIDKLENEISEREKIQEQLSIEKELLNQLVESIPGVVTVFNEDREYIHWNKHFEQFLAEAGKKMPLKWEDWMEKGQEEHPLQLFEDMFSGKITELDIMSSLASGQKRALHITARRIQFQGKPALLCISLDITEKKKAEEQLIREKNLSNQIIESMPALLLITDENMRFLRWNKNFEAATGFTGEELSSPDAVNMFFPDEATRATPFKRAKEIFQKGGTSRDEWHVFKDGQNVAFHVESRLIDYEGNPCILDIAIDITQRKNAEMQLAREKELSSHIIDSIPGLFGLFDENLRFVRWNKNFELASGYTPEEILQLHGIESFYDNEEDKKRTSRILTDIMDKGVGTAEVSPLMKDGKPVTIFFVGRSFYYNDKKYLITTGIDISDRKMAEEKLRQSESLLAEAEHLAHVGSWSLDLRNQKLTWSDELYQIFGVNPAEFDPTLNTVIKTTHPEDQHIIENVVEEAAKTQKPFDVHYRMRRSDGEERIVHVSGAVMSDEHGNASRLYGALQDVTESKQAEEELRLAYKRLSYHVENTPLAVVEWNKDLFITRWSGQAEKIFGWKASEVLGKNIYDPDIALIYKEDEEKVKNMAHEVLHKPIERNFNINRNYTKDKKVIYCEWHNSVLRDESGKIITIMSLGQDVTERTIAEEKLNESYNQIRTLTEHLQNIREEERTSIAREIHDELGQQLTVVKMDVAWLNKKLQEADSAVKEKTDGLLRLLDHAIQSVRRISSDLRPSILDDLGLAAAIEWHLNDFKKRTGIQVSFSEPAGEWHLPEKIKINLYRILQESLTNVVRHAQASCVNVKLEQTNNHLTLTIKDNGQGFDPEKAGERKTLGILGIKERTAMMGGSYNIESLPGQGTRISVTIPLPSKD